MSLNKRFILIFLLVILSDLLVAQTFRFIRYGEDEGLPAPLIKSVVRDENGVLWAASDDGLIRYDGREFRLFRDELPGPYGKSIITVNENDLLLTTDMGISRINDLNGNFKIETIARGSVHLSDTAMWFPKVFYKDFKERLWVSDNIRVYRYSDEKFISFDMGEGVSTNNYNRSFSFTDDGNGNFFAFSETGLVFLYDDLLNEFKPLPVSVKFSGIHAVSQSAPGCILIASREGLFEMKVTPEGLFSEMMMISNVEISSFARTGKGYLFAGTWSAGLFQIIKDKSGKLILTNIQEYPEKDVTHIYIDKDDDIWIASDAGIILMQETLFGHPFADLSNNYIQSLATDDKGFVYFTDGKSVFKADSGLESNARALFSSKAFLLQILPVDEGFWVSDAEGGICMLNKSGKTLKKFDFSKSGKAVFKLVRAEDGSIWACQDANEELIRITPDFNVKLYGRKQGLLSRSISLAVTSEGLLYSGGMTDSAYISVYFAANDRFVNLSEEVKFQRNIDINVNDIAIDPKTEDIWLGTSFGLIRIEKGNFSRADLGIYTDNSVKALAIDSLGFLWFANNKGLHRYKNGDLVTFDQRAGLPSKTIAYRGLLVDRQNRLWVGTLAGAAVSKQLSLPRKTLQPNIQSLIVNNIRVDETISGKLEITNKGFVNLRIASSEYPSRQLVYQQWIEGIDTTWVPVNADGVVMLAGMNPGDYKIKIRARRAGNYIYSDPMVLELKVLRIWYERWWVISLLVLASLALFWTGLLLYSRKLRKNNENLERVITQRTGEIKLQRDKIEAQRDQIIQKNEALNLKYSELEIAKNLADEAVLAKTQFLSVVSHEIRTPLNAVIGITHLLMRENPRPEQLEDLKILRFSAESLLNLINDVLDLNKMEAGKLYIESIDFNLKNLAEGIRSSMLHTASNKGIELQLIYDENLPLFIVSDPMRISQILNNLVSNAIKFTEKGGVLIEISLEGRSGKQLEIKFSVSDSGIGIPTEMHESIFESFTQASSDTSRRFGGTGLGLAITHKLLDMFGRRMTLVSSPGEGSVFSFVLSVEEADIRTDDNELIAEWDAFRFDGQKVLLVEDNKINAIIAKKFIENWNLVVDVAHDGNEAIEKLKSGLHDLVLMDLQMPDMDGYETTRRIRTFESEVVASVPVVALSASSKTEVQSRITEAGINDFVSKPFNPEELMSVLRKHLKNNS